MVKCPKCGKHIDHLHVNVLEEYTKSYYGGNGDFDEIDQNGTSFDRWRCPDCDEEIDQIQSQEDADKFLAGELPTPAPVIIRTHCTEQDPCCGRRGEYNGYPEYPRKFICPQSCPCHD